MLISFNHAFNLHHLSNAASVYKIFLKDFPISSSLCSIIRAPGRRRVVVGFDSEKLQFIQTIENHNRFSSFMPAPSFYAIIMWKQRLRLMLGKRGKVEHTIVSEKSLCCASTCYVFFEIIVLWLLSCMLRKILDAFTFTVWCYCKMHCDNDTF